MFQPLDMVDKTRKDTQEKIRYQSLLKSVEQGLIGLDMFEGR